MRFELFYRSIFGYNPDPDLYMYALLNGNIFVA